MTGRAAPRALLACDLDGTLITDDGSPAPGIVEALAELDARGARLVVCTGRPLHGAEKAVVALRAAPIAFVCYHGALVVDASTGEWLRHLTIPELTVSGIVRQAHLLGLSVTLYHGDDRRELAPTDVFVALDFTAPAGITRVVLGGGEARANSVLPAVAASWGHGVRVEHAGGGTVAILPVSADKGDGLRLIAARFGVPLERVVACGDSAADESLLRISGVSIAVGDPPDAALAGADEHVAQEGLARLLIRCLEPFTRLR
jgi:hydroxymethylpyrimidine pyrophosphatase-like HAD family hydrolase